MLRRLLGAAVVAAMVAGTAVAPAWAQTDDEDRDGIQMYRCQNNSHVFDRRECPENRTYPPGSIPGGGGGSGGLLGVIGRVLGGLTGGLL